MWCCGFIHAAISFVCHSRLRRALALVRPQSRKVFVSEKSTSTSYCYYVKMRERVTAGADEYRAAERRAESVVRRCSHLAY